MLTHDNKYEYVVIGSGFGGTITALTIANMLREENPKPVENKSNEKRVCILERGQWWINPDKVEDAAINGFTIQKYLDNNKIPFDFFPYPDNIRGLLKALKSFRTSGNVKGLYDFRAIKNVRIIAGSGVGGGSLIYFNVSERPNCGVYKNWPTESDGCPTLAYYFEKAEKFLGINSVSTFTALGKSKLVKSVVFQEAAKSIKFASDIAIESDRGDGGVDFDAKLSITDIPKGIFEINGGKAIHPTNEEIEKHSKESNVCLRLGRCGLGCPAGSRHSLDQKIYEAIALEKPIDVKTLCEVDTIEENALDNGYRYIVNIKNHQKNGNSMKIYANNVILAAGALGTTEILLRSKELKSNSALKLSNTIGHRFSTNGDMFGVISQTKKNVNSSNGPMITSIARFKVLGIDNQPFFFTIEDLGIPKMMSNVFASIFKIISIEKGSNKVLNLIRRNLDQLLSYFCNEYSIKKEFSNLLTIGDDESKSTLSEQLSRVFTSLEKIASRKSHHYSYPSGEAVDNMLILFGMGQDDAHGTQLRIDKSGNFTLKDEYDLDQLVYEKMVETMKMFAHEIAADGNAGIVIPSWNESKKIQITAHPLGGCPMAKSAAEGAVNSKGQIYRGTTGNEVYEGLFIADGSVIPDSLGVNPSLTISALAFRIAEKITNNRFYWP